MLTVDSICIGAQLPILCHTAFQVEVGRHSGAPALEFRFVKKMTFRRIACASVVNVL